MHAFFNFVLFHRPTHIHITRIPRWTWTRTVEKDLSALSIGLNAAWRRAQDREQWR